MKDFYLKPNEIKGYANRLDNVENTLKIVMSNIDDISSTLGVLG